MEILQVDPADETALRCWWEAGQASSAGRPHDPFPPWELVRRRLPQRDPERQKVALAAVDDAGRVLGTVLLQLPLQDNVHLAQVEIEVVPEHRGHGVGSRLLTVAEDLVRTRGRHTVVAEAAAAPGGTSPGTAFLEARGYAVANSEDRKILELATYANRQPVLRARVAERIGAYRVATWRDAAPEPYAEGFCALLTRFLGLIPLGDLDLTDSVRTTQRLRDNERMTRASGRRRLAAVAIAPDDALVAASDLTLVEATPHRAAVGITMVLPEHRGHALGLALKLASTDDLLSAYPDCEYVATGNARVNTQMNAINEQMGYRVVETVYDYQRVLA